MQRLWQKECIHFAKHYIYLGKHDNIDGKYKISMIKLTEIQCNVSLFVYLSINE